MLMRCTATVKAFIFRRSLYSLLIGFLVMAASPLWVKAQDFEPTLTVGGGIQGSYVHTQPQTGTNLDTFSLNHLRLYFSGDITKNFSAMINTDYSSFTDNMQVLDAVGEFHTSPSFNIWFGRFLPPSDRANFHGPFYSNEFEVYQDGIEDGYPAIYQGRDNGIAYWGDFKAGTTQVKVSLGAFDGTSLGTGSNTVLAAARVQLDFWDPEGGYYLNSTYYGDKNLLSIAGAAQAQGGKTATTVDFLMERKVMNGGAFTIESEFSRYNRLGGYDGNYLKSEGGFGLVSFLVPKPIGIGKVELLGKFAEAEFTDGISASPSYRQKTTDVELGYIIKQFDARVFAFGENKTFDAFQAQFSAAAGMKNYWIAGLGLQLQLSKQILGPK
jgi:hypothetical protein